ncbi:MAG: 3-hydroxyacyl-CoA dehydrogenase/enoyl-CoA hydratase family protein [Burkholderiaceae bacterium]
MMITARLPQFPRVAVLGAGVMGAQIAAHLANAGIAVDLLDLPSDADSQNGTPSGTATAKAADAPGGKAGGTTTDKNAIARAAVERLKKLEPAPLSGRHSLSRITVGNFRDDMQRLAQCSLIIEAVAERMEIKRSLYAQMAPHIGSRAIVASNTSGLSIEALAEEIPSQARSRFCGMHFFNPPRYMKLVELIAGTQTEDWVVDTLEAWLTQTLGKSVIRALDTPNFVANRIGVFSLLAVMHQTQAFGLSIDAVDALTGPRIGRPKSATYRTCDVVGIDTLGHVVKTMQDQLTNDPWYAHFRLPGFIEKLINSGALGQKSGRGLYRKNGKVIEVLDTATGDYAPGQAQVSAEVERILQIKNPAEQMHALRASDEPQAQFLWAIFRDVFHYSAVHLASMAHNARDLDLAMRWGFGWALGPFELWQAAGWQETAKAIAQDIAQGKAMSSAPLPDWCLTTDGAARMGVHTPIGSFSAATGTLQARSSLSVYRRQIFPERVLGESPLAGPRVMASQKAGVTLQELPGLRLWHLPEHDPGVGIVSFTSKMHAVGDEVLHSLMQVLQTAPDHQSLEALVLWHEPPFSVGANLSQVLQACEGQDWDMLENMVAMFQQAAQAIKYSRLPLVAAAQGLALGGGCEFLMHAPRRVMALETYAGLVEAGVGLIPAGGGCKEFALRAAQWAAQSPTPAEVFPFIQSVFTTIAMAKTAKSAHQVIEMGFGQSHDLVVFHPDELLYAALQTARGIANAGYCPALPPAPFPVAGRTGIANLDMMIVNMQEGGQISAHDARVAHAAAVALCGGLVDAGSKVSEDWIIQTERAEFMALLRTPETQARMAHMLKTGKPLRN